MNQARFSLNREFVMGYFSNAFGNYKCAVSATSGEPVVFVARREDWKMGTIWNRGLRGLAVALCLTLVFAPVVQAEAMTNAATGVIHGRVLLADSPLPVIGIAVRVVDLESAEVVAETTTDENGVATLIELPYGTYHVTVDTPAGMVSSSAPLVVLDNENVAPWVEFRLDVAVQDDDGLKDVVDEVSEDIISLVSGRTLRVDEDTEWRGDLDSVEAIATAIADGDNVCVAYEADPDEGDVDVFLASMLEASVCDDDTAIAFVAAGAAAAALGGAVSVGALLAGAALAAGGFAVGTAGITGAQAEPLTEVVTQ